jgi:hypothetical protein
MRFGRLVLSLSLAGTLMCCGVPPQEHPQPIDGTEFPSPSSIPTSAGQTEAALSEGVVYLIRSNRLAKVGRDSRTIQDQLAALLEGPTDSEQDEGLRTALPATGGMGSVRLDGTVAIVEVPQEFTALEGTEQILGVAQIVYTLTDGSVRHTAVRLQHDGRDLAAPTATGQLVTRPLSRADYASLAPR